MINNWCIFNKKKLFLVIMILFLAGSGFYKDLYAKSDQTYKSLKMFSNVLDIIEKNYVDEVDSKLIIEKAIQGMVNSLDPHSSLLLPNDFQELKIDTKGKFTGIGISLTIRDGFITVISPIEGTPAYKAGIKPGDRIIKVDNEPIKDLEEAVKKMRGRKNTLVKLTIIRSGLAEPIVFDLIRDVIPIRSVKSVLIKPGYGYVWVTNFREQTANDLKAALKKLEKNNTQLKGLIFDLRDNPGGLLPQAIEVSDIFLEKGEILSIKGRVKNKVQRYKAYPNEKKRDYPIVLLINQGSASASEIVAGALQDNKRALILGTRSFGKGSVQSVETLQDSYGLKLTIARYYTPSGRSIEGKGIQPDIVVQHRFIDQNTDKSKTDLKSKHHDFVNPHGPVNSQRLKSDNQVIQAMNILMGYEVLSSN